MNQVNFPKLSYRAEIDGLRAIAVISVIFYHAQILLFGRDWFEGGFIGVDIFFVISGYLIARIILSELQHKGSFSFLNFYKRRARRILPMLFVVIFVSFPYAWQKLLPLDFVEYAESILASLFFGSNFFFYFSTTEYGADSSLLKPFLHTWSLGVEEQFYLVFPIIAVLSFKFYRQHFLTILAALSLLSLQFAELMEVRNSELNFYLPFSRFWELAVGSMLAYRELNYKSTDDCIGKRILPMFGLYLIMYSILFFDSKTSHPSFTTIIPILGVALIIGFSSKDELVGKLLGSKPFVWIGLISYSAYLWHFPIFAFSRAGGKKLDEYDKFELILLTLILSVLSYLLIEKTFRCLISLKSFTITILFSILVVFICCFYIIKSEGVPTNFRFGFDPKIISSAQPSYLFGDKGCSEQDVLHINESQFCVFGNINNTKIDFLLIGDSHAMHAQPLLNKISLQYGIKGIFGGYSGCPPLLGIYPLRGNPHPNALSKRCYELNKNGYELIKNNNIKTVLLIARWDYYVDGADKGELNNISDASLVFNDIEYTRQVYRDAVIRTFYAYRELDAKVVVLLQVPHQKVNVKRFLEDLSNVNSIEARKRKFSKAINDGVLREEHLLRQRIASSKWKKLATAFKDSELTIIDPTDVFCGVERCAFITNEYAIYTDKDHASEFGFDRLEADFLKALLD